MLLETVSTVAAGVASASGLSVSVFGWASDSAASVLTASVLAASVLAASVLTGFDAAAGAAAWFDSAEPAGSSAFLVSSFFSAAAGFSSVFTSSGLAVLSAVSLPLSNKILRSF